MITSKIGMINCKTYLNKKKRCYIYILKKATLSKVKFFFRWGALMDVVRLHIAVFVVRSYVRIEV